MSRRASDPPELKGFTFSKILGSGGFSDVFLYEQALPKRLVAVKVLLTEALDSASRAAFVAEANLMAQLSNPYIVRIHHADVADDGRPYLIMEYCSGPNLAEQYKRRPFSVAEALRAGVRLSSAVATAHASGILHRDIKPANVLTNDYGWPALTDFGISSALEDDLPTMTTTSVGSAASGSTTGSQSVGMSIPWSPPEMFDDDPKPDVRSDVFSLSATIYTLLAGNTPFEIPGRPNQTLDLIDRIERGAITPMSRQDVPASLLAVLRKGMATKRDQRFATAVEFAWALQRVELELSYAPTAIEVPNLVVPAPEPRTNESREDATRARSVLSISAQPVPAVPTAQPMAIRPQVSQMESPVPAAAHALVVERQVEQTVIRQAGVKVEPVATAKPARTGRVVAVVSAVALLAVVAVIVAGFVTQPPASVKGPPIAQVGVEEGPITSSQMPVPVLVSASSSPDGTTAEFSWSNPDAQPGDTYVWQRTDGAGDPQRVPTDVPSVLIEGLSAGMTVCIDVYVRRGGELTPDPLEICVP